MGGSEDSHRSQSCGEGCSWWRLLRIRRSRAMYVGLNGAGVRGTEQACEGDGGGRCLVLWTTYVRRLYIRFA